MSKMFLVADLNANGELTAREDYSYAQLERIPGAVDLIGSFSGKIWRSPDGFDTLIATESGRLNFRWRSSAKASGIGTLRYDQELITVSLLASGLNEPDDTATLQAFQRHLLNELRDTGFEPAFALLDLKQRPLVASMTFASPDNIVDQVAAALVDRCFAASYFRFHQLA